MSRSEESRTKRRAYNARYYQENAERLRQWNIEYYQRTRDERLERRRRYYEENREKHREQSARWRELNPEAARRIGREWVKRNRASMNARHARYRAQRALATPVWADHDKMNEMYGIAAAWNSIWPEDPVHVDHVVPIRGKRVCGLHVHTNLQILRAVDNIRKNARFEE